MKKNLSFILPVLCMFIHEVFLIKIWIFYIQSINFCFYIIENCLMSLFSNLTLQLTFNQIYSTNLTVASAFAMLNSSNLYYYVSDWSLGKIFILNESWSYVSSKTFSSPGYFTTIGTSLYATGEKNIWKLDQYLNILIQYNVTGTTPSYRGIYYNSSNNFIYVAPKALNVIQVFNLNLIFHHNISTSIYYPWSIAGYNNQMYVGDRYNGTILVIENEVIVRTFKGCNGNSVQLSYILFDQCGFMATSCNTNQVYLYQPNGTYLSKNLATPSGPMYIGYDSNVRFVQISYTRINIYNN